MNRWIALSMLLVSAPSVAAASMADAFNDATQFGRAASTATGGQIRSVTPHSVVPGFTGSPSESAYFGTSELGSNAATGATACAMQIKAGLTPDPHCAAVEFSQSNAGRRPAFTLPPTDPMLDRARTITADPHSIAGNLAGTYSGCTTRTSTTPDIFETHFCNEYRVLERQTCEKTLSVTVTDNGLNCTPGTLITPNPRIVFIRPYVYVGALCADEIKFQWTYGYAECNGSNDSVYATTTVPHDASIRMPINLGCGGEYFLEGSCPDGNCSYRVGTPESCDEWCGTRCCDGYRSEDTLATFSFMRPKRTYTITDQWINQCAAYEARLP